MTAAISLLAGYSASRSKYRNHCPGRGVEWLSGLILMFSLSFASTRLQAAPLELKCPSPATEQARIRATAGVVTRTSAHQLQVRTSAGVQTFTDKPPHNEPLEGVHYFFCDRKEGFILLKVEDGVSFTGKLINEQTGAVTDAGISVLFSEDRRAYLISEYANGMDGNEWKVYSVKGDLSWYGYDSIQSKEAGQTGAALQDPEWMPNGELVATAACFTDQTRKWKVKLVKQDIVWSWAPRKKCPAGR